MHARLGALLPLAAALAGCGAVPGDAQPAGGHEPTSTSVTEDWLAPLPVRSTPTVPAIAEPVADGATPSPFASYDGPLLVDGQQGLVFVATVDGTVALDAADFSIWATSPISGGMALDPTAGVLYIDQPGRGLHRMDAATLASQWSLPLPDPTPDPRWSNYAFSSFAASGPNPPLWMRPTAGCS